MTRQILIELVFLSLSGTVLGLLLWLLRPLTRKLFSWKWHYYLWLAVLLRLALPVHVDMGWEILPARESGVSAVSELPEAGGQAFVDAQISGEQVSGEQFSGEQASGEQASVEQSSTEQFSTENLAEAEGTGQAQRNAAGTLSESARSFEWEALWQWGFLIWLAGAAASLAVRGLRCRRFLRYIKEDCRRVSEDRLQHLAGRLAEELRIPGWVWVYESPRTATPALLGLRRSFIVLPQAEWELKEAELVLRHELIHLKRKDLWYKALFQLVCCIHWFRYRGAPVAVPQRRLFRRASGGKGASWAAPAWNPFLPGAGKGSGPFVHSRFCRNRVPVSLRALSRAGDGQGGGDSESRGRRGRKF